MKSLFFNTVASYEDMLAETAELVKLEKEKGNEIYFIGCNASIDHCFAIKNKESHITCIKCQYQQRTILKDLQIGEKNMFFLKKNTAKPYPFEASKHIEEVKSYTYRDINLGIGIASSFISSTRDVDADIKDNKELLKAITNTAHTIIDSIIPIFEEVKPDKVYFYNGRVVEYRTVLEYCKNQNIPFTTYEVGSTINKYTTFENTLPHDTNLSGQLAVDFTNKNPKESQEKGTDWFINRKQGSVAKDKIDINYIGHQKKHKLPESFQKYKEDGKHIISIFNSSEDEIASLGNDIWKTYGRQSDIMNQVIEDFNKNNPDYVFYIRVHPNQKNLIDSAEVQKIIQIPQKYTNVEVILPAEDIDTYALMKESDKVLSFGSTTGIEATFWGKPSIVYGSAFYKNIPNAAYFPSSFENLIETLKNKTLKPLSKEAAIIYGYYISERGEDLKHYKYPLFTKNNRFESKKNISFLYLKMYNFLINHSFPMRFFPQKKFYNLFLRK
ncbi:hypothetical protein V9L05_11970 [Bernardetia sp. Wsw4-3y2]|uniref:capsular polysaccharide export protein, LipB/KpsS family n=1 Tax=Bernardetia sp. Wsw4-3y2 TaxID=3127471 RepID=UPI0030D29429